MTSRLDYSWDSVNNIISVHGHNEKETILFLPLNNIKEVKRFSEHSGRISFEEHSKPFVYISDYGFAINNPCILGFPFVRIKCDDVSLKKQILDICELEKNDVLFCRKPEEN